MKEKGRINIVNRDEFPLFVDSPIVPWKIQRRVKSVHFEMVSFDEEYERLRKQNKAFLVTSAEIYVNGVDGEYVRPGVYVFTMPDADVQLKVTVISYLYGA